MRKTGHFILGLTETDFIDGEVLEGEGVVEDKVVLSFFCHTILLRKLIVVKLGYILRNSSYCLLLVSDVLCTLLEYFAYDYGCE